MHTVKLLQRSIWTNAFHCITSPYFLPNAQRPVKFFGTNKRPKQISLHILPWRSSYIANFQFATRPKIKTDRLCSVKNLAAALRGGAGMPDACYTMYNYTRKSVAFRIVTHPAPEKKGRLFAISAGESFPATAARGIAIRPN